MRHFRLSLLVCLMASLALAQSAARPNFSGIFKLNVEKSDFGGVPVPNSAQYIIRHVGSKLVFQYNQDGNIAQIEATPDGTERVTETSADSETLTRAYWSENELVLEARVRPLPSANRLPVRWTSRWSLSPDRKVLTIRRHITSERAAIDQVVVFDRQPLAK